MRNLFVIAPNAHNQRLLEPLEDQLDCRFRGILEFSDVQSETGSPFAGPFARICEELDAFEGSIDGIMGYWDFPVTSLVPLLQARYGCPGPSPEAVLRCEHKYQSRLLQREVAPDHVPDFRALDPFDDEQVRALDESFGFPFWIKPIKAHSSQLGFRVEGHAQLKTAIAAIRAGIAHFAEPFDEVLAEVPLGSEADHVKGGWCIAEKLIGGHQCTLEGYVHGGEVTIPTIVDSVTVRQSSSFARYQYPSKLPRSVKQTMRAVAAEVMLHHGYDEATFNIEMYWDEAADRIWLLEINPRASQSHTVITAMVDGLPHLEAMAALALGQAPAPHVHGRGPYAIAAKCFMRVRDDALVERAPTDAEIAALEDQFDCHIQLHAKAGRKLSELIGQDSYTYSLAAIHLGAADEDALLAKYREVVAGLRFRFDRRTRRSPTALSSSLSAGAVPS